MKSWFDFYKKSLSQNCHSTQINQSSAPFRQFEHFGTEFVLPFTTNKTTRMITLNIPTKKRNRKSGIDMAIVKMGGKSTLADLLVLKLN